MSDARIEKIEERIAWLEHHVAQQDKAMLEMAQRLDRQQAELVRLREREARVSEGGAADMSHERPPHY